MDTVDLNCVSLNRPIAGWTSPAERGRVGTYAGQGDIGGLGDIDTKNID